MKHIGLICFALLLCGGIVMAQTARETYDSSAVARIIDEGMNHSQVMEVLSYISDVYGPRLTGSPAYKRAAEWAVGKLSSLGLENAHLEGWGPFGRGWELRHYSANVLGSQVFPLLSYPKAWSPGTGGTVTADLVYLDASTDSALNTYQGKLKGKFVMMGDLRDIKAPFEPEADRLADSTLLQMANADMPMSRGQRRFEMNAEMKARALVDYHKYQLIQKEGVVGILTASRGDGGNLFVQQASVPMHPDTPFARRIAAYDPKAPRILPQISVAAEHFNRLVRMMKKGEHPKLEVNLDVNFFKEDSGYNVIAEIPGTDLKDEVVMIGAHFDSWHGGTGATDDGTGSAACIEAVRILKQLGLKPRRTIRIGLWGGEEQGLLGSKAYVDRHLGTRGDPPSPGQPPVLKLTKDAEKFCVYFNHDNGTGKLRGVYMQGNESVRPIFRSWLKPFAAMGASTLTLGNTGGTDHLSFDAIYLPGFQFIQDEIDYDTRTHHSIMDVYDRVQADDMKQASSIMAAFAYNAAMRDAMFPHKPLPAPSPTPVQGSK